MLSLARPSSGRVVDGTGLATESSGGFILPDSAMSAPDAAWIRRDRLDTVPEEQQRQLLPLCPDFVIELLPPADVPSRMQAKMRGYIDNGLRLGRLIDPFERQVHVHRPGTAVRVLDAPDGVDGGPVLPASVSISVEPGSDAGRSDPSPRRTAARAPLKSINSIYPLIRLVEQIRLAVLR